MHLKRVRRRGRRLWRVEGRTTRHFKTKAGAIHYMLYDAPERSIKPA
jgi:hypothetical protein